MSDSQKKESRFESPLLPFRSLGIFVLFSPQRPSSLSCINEYLAIDSGGNVSDLVFMRNCCMARMRLVCFREKPSWCRNEQVCQGGGL